MGNIITTLKRFLANKNTVTIIGVLLGLVVLFIGYNYRVNNAVETQVIPYATRTITATSEITKDAVSTMEVLRSTVKDNTAIISNINSVLNTNETYCASDRSNIPAGSFFYTEQVIRCEDVANNALKRMPDDYRAVNLPVDLQDTYGNSMYPGDFIDIYAKMDIDGKLFYGEFITKLPILDVRDSNGRSVFYGNNQNTTPALLLFACPKELYELLSSAILLGTSKVELIPVPGNARYTSEEGETEITSEFIRDRIEYYLMHDPGSTSIE